MVARLYDVHSSWGVADRLHSRNVNATRACSNVAHSEEGGPAGIRAPPRHPSVVLRGFMLLRQKGGIVKTGLDVLPEPMDGRTYCFAVSAIVIEGD